MSFKLFIYYCTLGGGWAAFLAWAFVQAVGIGGIRSLPMRAALIGGFLGLFVAAAVGFIDALFNAVGVQRYLRALVCMVVGLVGGMFGGFIGEVLHDKARIPGFVGWMLTGICIGASIGIFDLLQALSTGSTLRIPIKKTLNGVYGGLLGGLIGGAPFTLLMENEHLSRSNLAVGLLVVGLSVGLLIGLAQVVLKEAWLKIERGPRAGKEVMLTKDEIVIGRGESCDVGIFGDMDIDKKHARIRLESGRYALEDLNSVRGTFVNDRRVGKPQELVTGDLIRVGSCYLRFGERTKRV